MTRDHFADFPEPPEGMTLRVQRAAGTVTLTGFHHVSAAQNKAQKLAYGFLLAPFCFTLFAGFLDGLVHLTFFHEPVTSGDGAAPLPRWVVLTAIIPFWAAGTLLVGLVGVWLIVVATRLTTERRDWELRLCENAWRVTFFREPFFESDSSTEQWTLKPSEITGLGVDAGGRVYCEEATQRTEGAVVRRVELTAMLSKAEAAWVEQALRPVLTFDPSIVKPFG